MKSILSRSPVESTGAKIKSRGRPARREFLNCEKSLHQERGPCFNTFRCTLGTVTMDSAPAVCHRRNWHGFPLDSTLAPGHSLPGKAAGRQARHGKSSFCPEN
jgi:hypothetical protein